MVIAVILNSHKMLKKEIELSPLWAYKPSSLISKLSISSFSSS